jgi:hypothetical protein
MSLIVVPFSLILLLPEEKWSNDSEFYNDDTRSNCEAHKNNAMWERVNTFQASIPFQHLRKLTMELRGALEIVRGEFERRLSSRLFESLEKTQKSISLEIEVIQI